MLLSSFNWRSAQPLAAAVLALLLIIIVFVFYYLGRAVQAEAGPVTGAPALQIGEAGLEPPIANAYFSTLHQWINEGEELQLREAVGRLRQLSPNDPSYLWGQFLLGAAHYKLEQYEEAASYFERTALSEQVTARNRQWSDYYQLLSLLEAGKAKPTLQPIIDRVMAAGPSHIFFQQVKRLEEEWAY